MFENKFIFSATGTRWEVDYGRENVSNEVRKKIESVIITRINKFENCYSRFRKNSLVEKISKTRGVYRLPDDAQRLFDFYIRLYEITGGKFTPLIGDLLSMAGYDRHYSFNQRGVLRSLPPINKVWEYNFPEIEVKMPWQLDFGAAGKGYLVDIVGNLLKNMGIDDFCIDAGGDILQRTNQKTPLIVGLENPSDENQVIGVVDVINKSICGSSGSRRRWNNFHHIINPMTLSSPSDVIATWAMSDSAMEADGLATCLFFTTPKDLTDHFDFEYLILRNDFSVEKPRICLWSYLRLKMRYCMKSISTIFDKLSIYNLVIWGLALILGYSTLLSFWGLSPFNWMEISLSVLVVCASCLLTNYGFSKLLNIKFKYQPTLVTALIITLIVAPSMTWTGILLSLCAGMVAIASKYLLVLKKRHIFNPVALSLFILSFWRADIASWWVGSSSMLPVMIIVGTLVIWKFSRQWVFGAFLISSVLAILFFGIKTGINVTEIFLQVFSSWPIIFFGTVMLTEPMTSPATKNSQIVYGVLVGIIFGSSFKIGSIYSSPELALLVGNIFAYFVSFRQKLFINFRMKIGLLP